MDTEVTNFFLSICAQATSHEISSLVSHKKLVDFPLTDIKNVIQDYICSTLVSIRPSASKLDDNFLASPRIKYAIATSKIFKQNHAREKESEKILYWARRTVKQIVDY